MLKIIKNINWKTISKDFLYINFVYYFSIIIVTLSIYVITLLFNASETTAMAHTKTSYTLLYLFVCYRMFIIEKKIIIRNTGIL